MRRHKEWEHKTKQKTKKCKKKKNFLNSAERKQRRKE